MTMALTAGDRAMVREIAFEVSNVMLDRVREIINTAVELHSAKCEAKVVIRDVKTSGRWLLAGIAVGAGLAGGGGAVAVAKFLSLL
jgi:hypothetical protein